MTRLEVATALLAGVLARGTVGDAEYRMNEVLDLADFLIAADRKRDQKSDVDQEKK